MLFVLTIIAIALFSIVFIVGFCYVVMGIDYRDIKMALSGVFMLIFSAIVVILLVVYDNTITTHCPVCNTFNYRKEYCTNCGTHLSYPYESSSVKRCPNCNNKVSADNHYCGHCGIDLYENITE